MSLLQRFKGAQNQRIPIWLADGTSTVGAGKTGLSGSSTGLIIATRAEGEAAPVIYTAAAGTIDPIATIGVYVAPVAGKCRFGQVDANNEPGSYELQLDNARLNVGGATWLKVTIQAIASSVPVQQFLLDLGAQSDVRAFGGQAGTFNNGLPSVDLSTIGGVASNVTVLAGELAGRVIGTITNISIAPTNAVFDCIDIADADTDPVYQNRGVLVMSGVNIRRVSVVLTDTVGPAGRRITIAALPDAFASGDKILIL